MTTVVTRGAASAQALGYASSSAAVTYIEDVFSTYLYTGNGSTQTITNGIDLSTKGGLVWLKRRGAIDNHFLWDTARGAGYGLIGNLTNAQGNYGSAGLSAFNSTGFSLGSYDPTNGSTAGNTYASWTFREQPKFFDVVTYTGDGVAGRSIAHNLGSDVGALFIKCTSSGGTFWIVWHRSEPTKFCALNQTSAFSTSLNGYTTANIIGDNTTVTTPTSTNFTVGNSSVNNSSGATYVAYLFAHDAGGFGLTGTDNVISCGSFADPASGGTTEVTLGYEPQWLLVKPNLATTDWYLIDNMRGMVRGTATRILNPNLSDAESNGFSNGYYQPTATGFTAGNTVTGGGGTQCVYIAIRRGPMKVPTSGTQVYNAIARTGTSATAIVTGAGFPPDLVLSKGRNNNESGAFDRLRGPNKMLFTTGTTAETTSTDTLMSFDMDGYTAGADASYYNINKSTYTYINWLFRRAPGFFDEVCWTGDGTNPRSLSHNLTVAPTLIITKKRNSTSNWITGYDFTSTTYKYFFLNDTGAANPDTYASTPVYGGNPTASVFIVGNQGNINQSGDTYVSYLFATVAGVSKVGSYTGTGTTQTINCGFTAGARFVLIKRTDSTGDWYVWDSARGIVAGNDPYLLLNSTAAEVTGTDYVDTASSGFEISSTAPAAINANGGSFIFLAIA